MVHSLVLLQIAIDSIFYVLGAPIDEPIIALLPDELVAVIDHLEGKAHLLGDKGLRYKTVVLQGKFNKLYFILRVESEVIPFVKRLWMIV